MRKFTAFSAIVCGFCVLLSACSDLGSISSSRSAVVSLKIPAALFSESTAAAVKYKVDALMYDADTDTAIESLSTTVASGGSAAFTFSPVEAGRAVMLSINVYDSDGTTLYMSGKSARYVVVEGDQSVDITLTKVQGVTDYVDSESDLETCIADSVIEYYTFFKSLSSSRAAATSDDATKQAEAFFDALLENSSAITEFINDFGSGIQTSTNISFDQTVDLSDLTVENGLTSFVDTYNYIEAQLSQSGTTITEASLIQKIADGAGITTNQADALYTALNTYAEINTLYLRAKLDVNAGAEGSSTYASAAGSINVKLTVPDVNALLFSVLQNAASYCGTTLSLPVSAVSYSMKGDISASITAENYAAAAEITDPSSVDWNTYLPLTASYGVTAGIKICTKSGLGGNITYSAGTTSFTTGDIYTISNLQQQLDDGEITEETYKQELYSLLDNIMKYTVTVTDDSGNTKWTADYTSEGLESVEKAVSEKISAEM
jgi:hypothetical protein